MEILTVLRQFVAFQRTTAIVLEFAVLLILLSTGSKPLADYPYAKD